eukprot:10962499-Alexandrium_andersonii.AAC.1
MGWTWSVFLAQMVHERVITSLSCLRDRAVQLHFVEDGREVERAFAYIDDGGVMGNDPDRINVEHRKIKG